MEIHTEVRNNLVMDGKVNEISKVSMSFNAKESPIYKVNDGI